MEKLIYGIHHVALRTTPDTFDKVVDFYTNLLGLEIVRTWGEGDRRAMMVSTGDNSMLEILPGAAGEKLPEGPFAHLAFATDAVDALIEKVRAAGFHIQMEPADVDIASDPVYPVRIAFCTGPVNETIEFFHVR